jgi:hypothetical protein
MYSSMRLSSAITLEKTTGALRSAPRGVCCPLAGAEYDVDLDHEVEGGDPATGEPISIACRLRVPSASDKAHRGAGRSSEIVDGWENVIDLFVSVVLYDVRAEEGRSSPCPRPELRFDCGSSLALSKPVRRRVFFRSASSFGSCSFLDTPNVAFELMGVDGSEESRRPPFSPASVVYPRGCHEAANASPSVSSPKGSMNLGGAVDEGAVNDRLRDCSLAVSFS